MSGETPQAEPDAGDVKPLDGLAVLIEGVYNAHPRRIAEAVLASDWLAARETRVRRETAERVAKAIEDDAGRYHLDARGHRQGAARLARQEGQA